MKFDPSAPYGEVIGHPWAKYEQNGVLYTPDGDAQENKPVVIIPDDPLQSTNSPDEAAAVTFLQTLLHDTRVLEGNVAKEADIAGITGENLTKAAEILNVQKVTEGLFRYWKLGE